MAEPSSRTRPRPTGQTLQFMQRLWELVHAMAVRSKRMGKTLGVTGPQRLVIRVVGQSPDATARDIAQMLGLHPSTLTGVLARLERQKMIVRKVDPDDRRRVRFRLTPEGLEIDRERKGTVEAAVRRALSRAEPAMISATEALLALLVTELSRDD
ncbi:MAG TPA: MarR family transcriptional regulator [Kofleriaceae bacterium]|nr:MarR family transcriptional regulator [Kofleriaceae bacterium]